MSGTPSVPCGDDVVSEIGVFALSGRLSPSVGPTALLGIGAIGAVLRWSDLALDPAAEWLPLLQCPQGLSYGATHLGSMQFLSHIACGDGSAGGLGGAVVVLSPVIHHR
jgi:MFS transporter, PPP family, 3-phenylpropionic acid transporter